MFPTTFLKSGQKYSIVTDTKAGEKAVLKYIYIKIYLKKRLAEMEP